MQEVETRSWPQTIGNCQIKSCAIENDNDSCSSLLRLLPSYSERQDHLILQKFLSVSKRCRPTPEALCHCYLHPNPLELLSMPLLPPGTCSGLLHLVLGHLNSLQLFQLLYRRLLSVLMRNHCSKHPQLVIW